MRQERPLGSCIRHTNTACPGRRKSLPSMQPKRRSICGSSSSWMAIQHKGNADLALKSAGTSVQPSTRMSSGSERLRREG